MSQPAPTRLAEQLAVAPLVPVAAAVTLGLAADHFLSVPLAASIAAGFAALAGWLSSRGQAHTLAPVGWIALAAAALAAGYHRFYRDFAPADDIAARAEPGGALVRVRGELDGEPLSHRRRHNDPLVSVDRPDTTSALLEVGSVQVGSDWAPASGRLRLSVPGELAGLHAGDEIEALGWLTLASPPLNPGESDYAEHLRADRVRAELHVRKVGDSVVRLHAGWRGSLAGWLGMVRGWGQRTLQTSLPASEAPVAVALLLGEGAPMTQDDWDRYVRTGVIHVLAISGQHLALLGAFAWIVLRLLAVPRRRAAVLVALGLLGYALLTGGRPSAMRAAVMVCAVSGAILLGRRALPANTFALAWLAVLALNPTDLFTAGFQLSFLAVAVLIWGLPNWFPRPELSAQERLLAESRSFAARCVRGLGTAVLEWYRITLVLGLATAPLVMYWQNVVSPVGLLIGPPVILLSAFALVGGFLLLLAEALGGLLTGPFAWFTALNLAGCDGLVSVADRLPGACWYTGPVPAWWLAGFYGLGIAWLAAPAFRKPTPAPQPTQPPTPAPRPSRWRAPVALAGWACLGLLAGASRPLPDELRLTFLAVGHGGCIVLETPDGRCLLYDAGALGGPDVTRRQIAPFLWSRGVRRLDEVILSHADLDHFNGLPGLVERFRVGQVTVTPSFADKPATGVAAVTRSLQRAGIPMRVVRAGDHIVAGGVDLEVLHPPVRGPEGAENVRSMVLLVRHEGHAFLLTGDLEKEGLAAVAALPRRRVDVLMAPHHGSPAANPGRLLGWSRPRLAVASQEPPRPTKRGPDPYEQARVPLWRTCDRGAITFHSHRTGLVAEAFRTGERLVVHAGAGEK